MSDPSRRRFLASLGIAALHPVLGRASLGDALQLSDDPVLAPAPSSPASRGMRVRTITAGLAIERLTDRAAVGHALAALGRARKRFESEGYEVQTTRVIMPPLIAAMDAKARNAALASVSEINALVASSGALCSLGPVWTADRLDPDLAGWSTDLVKATKVTSFSVVVASPTGHVHARGAKMAAQVMHAVAGAVPEWKGELSIRRCREHSGGHALFPRGVARSDQARSRSAANPRILSARHSPVRAMPTRDGVGSPSE